MRVDLMTMVIVGGACAGIAGAGISYDETTDGDLSNDRFAPTALALTTGVNTVSMDVVNSNDTVNGDLDYFTFNLGSGFEITSIVLAESSNPAGPGDSTAFVGLAFDSVFDFDPIAQTGPGLVGFVLTGPAVVGADVLGPLSDGNPTGAGDYAFWVQQTGPDLTRVTLDITVVPAPGAASVLALGMAVAACRRR